MTRFTFKYSCILLYNEDTQHNSALSSLYRLHNTLPQAQMAQPRVHLDQIVSKCHHSIWSVVGQITTIWYVTEVTCILSEKLSWRTKSRYVKLVRTNMNFYRRQRQKFGTIYQFQKGSILVQWSNHCRLMKDSLLKMMVVCIRKTPETLNYIIMWMTLTTSDMGHSGRA